MLMPSLEMSSWSSGSTMWESLAFLMVERQDKNLRLNKVQFEIYCYKANKELNRVISLRSISLAFEATLRGEKAFI